MSKINLEKVSVFRNARLTRERYSIREIVKDTVYNITHVERKRFVYTAADLFINPGKSIKKVLSGYRQYLYNPSEYLIVCGAIVLFLTPRYKFFQNEFSENISSSAFLKAHSGFFNAFFTYAEQYATITNILAIPVFTILSYLIFADSKRTIGENLIINTYITAQQLLVLVFCAPFIELFPSYRHTIITVYTEIAFIYNVAVYTLLFTGKWWWVLIRGIVVVALGYLLQFPVNVAFYYFFSPLLSYLPDF